MTKFEKKILRVLLKRLEKQQEPRKQKEYNFPSNEGIFDLSREQTKQAIFSLHQKGLLNGKGAFTVGERHVISLTPEGQKWALNDAEARSISGLLRHPLVTATTGGIVGSIITKFFMP